jgi:hypothetical protein
VKNSAVFQNEHCGFIVSGHLGGESTKRALDSLNSI